MILLYSYRGSWGLIVACLAHEWNARTSKRYIQVGKGLIVAVPLTHRNLITTMKNVVNTYKLTPKDRSYLVAPLFHVHGLLAGFLAPLQSGGTVIIPPKFSATTFWPEFTKYKATWYTAGLSPLF